MRRSACLAAIAALLLGDRALTQSDGPQNTPQNNGAVLKQYCAACHSATVKTAGVVIDPAAVAKPESNPELWERVIRHLRNKTMPPVGMPRPDQAAYTRIVAYLEDALDRAAVVRPNAGELPNLRRLTRTEYKNAVRDLLGLDNLPREMEFTFLLPADNNASGFDNIADLLYMSPSNMERYLDAATKIARLAVGDKSMPVMVSTYRLPKEEPQDSNAEGMPYGTRGGTAIAAYFPLDAEYDVDVDLAGGGPQQHQLEISVDGERRQLLPFGGGGRVRGAPPTSVRIAVQAGPHSLGVAFLQKTEALDESTLRRRQRTRGTQPAVSAVTIRGPYNAVGPGETPSRERIFACHPQSADQENTCARQIVGKLARLAYRGPVTEQDLSALLKFYQLGRAERDFELGIQSAIERMLVSPQFLYRTEVDPAGVPAGASYRLSDLELASRLSFFLWSSIPDEELIQAAERRLLRDPATFEKQVRRMLADDRSEAMVSNFAAQWLYLRDLPVKEPDLFLFREFDEGLRRAFQRETELFLHSVLRENRSVAELLTANYTFVNARLAKHYGIPNVRGSRFQRVTFPQGSPRGGLLGQGSILTLTSYSTRTSPVLRGKYVLENLLASPPPPPPANVPSLKTEDDQSKALTLREAMTKHRANPACANCHARMDPIGFAMENFDGVGQWRDHDGGKPVEVSSTLADGTIVDGIAGVRALVLRDPERFAAALTEKLLMFACARNVQYFDVPAIRQIVREARGGNFQFSDLVLGVTRSAPFQMRTVSPKKIAAVRALEERNNR